MVGHLLDFCCARFTVPDTVCNVLLLIMNLLVVCSTSWLQHVEASEIIFPEILTYLCADHRDRKANQEYNHTLY